MKNFKLGLSLLLLSGAVSCKQAAESNQQVDEGQINSRKYSSEEIGWIIQVPEGWKITSLDSALASEKTGIEAIEKVYGGGIQTTELRHLIGFEKDLFNNLSSTSEPFKLEYPGEYEENNQKLYEVVYDALDAQGVKIDTSSSAEVIRGMKFDTFYSTIYDINDNIVMYQILYSRLINGFDFSVNINYNNEADKKVLVDAFKNSEFTSKQ